MRGARAVVLQDLDKTVLMTPCVTKKLVRVAMERFESVVIDLRLRMVCGESCYVGKVPLVVFPLFALAALAGLAWVLHRIHNSP